MDDQRGCKENAVFLAGDPIDGIEQTRQCHSRLGRKRLPIPSSTVSLLIFFIPANLAALWHDTITVGPISSIKMIQAR